MRRYPAPAGVYVAGAIAPADRATLVRHLATCERCRDELASLAALPALLRRLPAWAAAQPYGESAAAPERDAGGALLGRVLSRMAVRRRRRRRALAAAATVLAAIAGTGWALRPGSPPPGPAAAGSVLGTERIGGGTVLADAAGFTLYGFAPDTATRSSCDGSCARRWPPVTGPATAGTGVTGAVGWITRSDQARGNGVNASGGRWHEVTVPGAAGPPPAPTRIRTASGGNPAVCSPLSPLTVPLPLLPRHPDDAGQARSGRR